MGGRFSGDVRGGMEAVGGGGGRSRGAAQAGGPNDAVDHFFLAQGLRGLYTPLEVRTVRPPPFQSPNPTWCSLQDSL
jgi:hypothetical protein